MATIISTNSPAVSFSHNPAPVSGLHEGVLAPSFGGGLGEAMDRTYKLSLLVEVNSALAVALDVESVLGGILSRLAGRERLTRARIYRLDEPARELRRVACGGTNGTTQQVVPLEEPSLVAWVVRNGEAVYIPQVEKDRRCQGFGPEERCAYAVPLRTCANGGLR